MATGLALLWCLAGLAGLHVGGVGAARGWAAWADSLFAMALGPFSFLISMLASEMDPDELSEEHLDASVARECVRGQSSDRLAR